MRRIVPLLLAAGLAASWIGCQSATDSEVIASSAGATGEPATGESSTDEPATEEFTLVTLKVPNMT